MFADRLQIRQHLTGMAEIGQPIDDGDGAVFRQALHLRLGEGADHDAVQIPGQHPGGILHRLTPADLQIPGGEEKPLPAQLIDARFKRHPGASGGFLKNHSQGFARQQRMGDAVPALIFQLVGQIEDTDDILLGKIQQLEQMLHGNSLPFNLSLSGPLTGPPEWIPKWTVPCPFPPR